MGSLTAHLVETGDHGRLGFHPNCPVCRRERLFGALSSETVVSRRAQAALASGVLAFTTAAPGVALAQEPDVHQEGIAAPEQPSTGDLDSPSFDPGGETALPFETGQVPTPPQLNGQSDPSDVTPLETEPTVDSDVRLVPITEPETPATGPDQPVPPTEADPGGDPTTSTSPPSATVPVTPQPDGPVEMPSTPAPDPAPVQESERTSNLPDSDQAQKEKPHGDGREPTGPVPPHAPTRSGNAPGGGASPEPSVPGALPEPVSVSSGGDSASPPPPTTLTTGAPEAVASASAAGTESVLAAQPGAARESTQDTLSRDARFHVVAPGDSLWSIAKRLLGSDASPARIAREVHRLWSLNSDRIGTGDPDLLMIGTRLRLR
jgi:hypothetical protein